MVTASDVVDAGFFGYVGVGTVITNLTNAANVTSLAQGLDVCHIGGIVGRAMGFSEVYCQMNSTYIIACHNTGTITNGTGMTSYSTTGGIAGFIYGGTCVLACSNTGDLADNDLSNSVLVGGVVGLGIKDYDTEPSIVSCWTGKGAILGDGVVIQRANYSTDSNCSDEEFYTESFTDELLNEELNFWIYMFNYMNYDYTYDMGFEERDINCDWHWELKDGSVVLKPGAPEYSEG